VIRVVLPHHLRNLAATGREVDLDVPERATLTAAIDAIVDLDRQAALAALERRPPAERPELYGGGHAAERVCDVVSAYTPTR